MKDGKDISNSSKYSTSYASGRCSLEINDAELIDAGKYSCVATNKLGEAECSCKIQVSGKWKKITKDEKKLRAFVCVA